MRQLIVLFAALLGLAGCSGVTVLNTLSRGAGSVEHDVSYGPLETQTLDIYKPADMDGATPVLLFVHGGSWQDGSKDDYVFFGNAFAGAGIETVVIDYRLHPEVIYPAFVEDAAKALVYTRKEIAGDRPIFLAGHSAGAHIAALVAADPRFLEAEGTDICAAADGFIGISGPYDYTFTEEVYKRIFPEEIRETSKPVNHADGRFPPALLLHGTADSTVKPSRTTQMEDALKAAGNDVEAKMYDGADHLFILGAVAPLLQRKAPTFKDMTAFIRRHQDPWKCE